jgi:simple sugar transport system substrate-binding protein
MMDGKWSTGEGPDHWAGNTWVGMADDYLVLSPFEKYAFGCCRRCGQGCCRYQIRQNKIFTGPIKDNSGKIRVPAGKTLTDGELFQTLDYYVDGIFGQNPGLMHSSND